MVDAPTDGENIYANMAYQSQPEFEHSTFMQYPDYTNWYRSSQSNQVIEPFEPIGEASRGVSMEVDEEESDQEESELPRQDSMMYAQQEDNDDPDWIDNAYVNNDVVEFEEPPPDDEREDWIQSSMVENVAIEHHQGTVGDTIDDGFTVGETFDSKDKLINAITEWSIKRAVEFKPIKSNKTCYSVVCSENTERNKDPSLGSFNEANERCPWKLYASVGKKTGGQFKITQYNGVHTCCRATLDLDGRKASSAFICNLIMPAMKVKLDLTPGQIQDRIRDMLHINVSYYRAWHARTKALSKIFGDWEESYQRLPQYLTAIQATNPGTVFHVATEDVCPGVVQFNSVFWAFGPSIEGFKHCRPILSIDGTHLYGKYKGCLLVATGVDADGGLYPLAFAVVKIENMNSWEWFFSCIYHFIPSVRHPRKITFISDRMKGIPTALQNGWGAPHHHRYCLRHIRENFKRAHKDTALLNLFWQAGCASEEMTYQQLRNDIASISIGAHQWIENSLGGQESRWTLHKDSGRRFCIMTTNCSESFNGVLKGARALPIQALVARTFYRIIKYFYKRGMDAGNIKTQLTPKNEAILRSRASAARYYGIQRFSRNEWEVTDSDGCSYTVKLEDDKCHCTCNMPKLEHMPCAHVIASCSRQAGGANISYYTFCSPWFRSSHYKLAYSPLFHPVMGSQYWTEYDGPRILPPEVKRQAGRSRSTRIESVGAREGDRRQNRCSNCKQLGHYKSRCPNPPHQ